MYRIYIVYGCTLFMFYFSYDLIAAIQILFYLKNELSYFQIGLINVFFSVGVALLEIPTGLLADTKGKKTSFLLGCLVLALGFVVTGLSEGFLTLGLAQLLIALGQTFYSGAFDAWAVNSLSKYSQSNSKLLFQISELCTEAGSVAGILVGAYLWTIKPVLPWFVGGLGFFIIFLLNLLAMVDNERTIYNKAPFVVQIKNTSLSAFHITRINLIIYRLFLFSIAYFAFRMSPFLFWQPFFSQLFYQKNKS